jgi:hypothetical protein
MGKDKGTTRTRTLTRRATFIKDKHLVVKRGGAPVRTLNVVKRAALNKNAPEHFRAARVKGKRTVFFKAHHNQNAASQYAVASTRLARFLGMDEIIAHNAFAKVKSAFGAVSGAVPGAPLYSEEKNEEVPVPEGANSPLERKMWVDGCQLDERNGKYYKVSKQIYQWVDFRNPDIQRSMSDLQLFDAITGQFDRHAGNIFVDPKTGQVSGIDDDKSFGGGVAVDQQANRNIPGRQYYRGLPALVDEKTAQTILDLDPTKLPELLSAADTDTVPLTNDEIADAVRRFDGVRQYLRDLQKAGALVGQNGTSWNDETYDQALADPTTSYLGSQADTLDKVRVLSATDPKYVIVGAPAPPAPPQVPTGVDFAEILQRQQTPPGNVPPITINQPPTMGLRPPVQRGPIIQPTQDAAQAARARWVAVRPNPVVRMVPQGQATTEADTDESGTTSQEDDAS